MFNLENASDLHNEEDLDKLTKINHHRRLETLKDSLLIALTNIIDKLPWILLAWIFLIIFSYLMMMFCNKEAENLVSFFEGSFTHFITAISVWFFSRKND